MSEYMIIWMNQSPVEFAVSLSKVDSHHGVVRSAKGQIGNKGIRFCKSDYLQAFAILKPDDELPNMIAANFYFKISPTPVGSTSPQVQKWLSAQDWEARPVKSLSGDCWLCVAEKRFEAVFAQWNGSPIIVKWLDDRKRRDPVILAGNVQKPLGIKAIENVKQLPPGGDSNMQFEDPWKFYNSDRMGAAGSSALLQPRSAISAAVPLQPARKLEGPIEDRFSRHDTALQNFKQHTDGELDALKESIQKIERSIECQNATIKANMEQTGAEFTTLRTETANQLQALTGAFTDSLKTSIAAQESQISVQFNELKDMIMAQQNKAVGSSPPQKKPKKADGKSEDADL